MCTVTYIPLPNSSYLFTHNRDEKKTRAIATLPRRYAMGTGAVVMPIDPISNGTWIAMSSCVFSLCILNGGFHNHESKPAYANSRGQIILDFFKYGNAKKMSDEYNWQLYEPFTFIIVQHIDKNVFLFEIVWDGNNIHYTPKDASSSYIWSSSTLYTDQEKTNRQKWFDDFIETTPIIAEQNIIDFHHFVPEDKEVEGFIINRKNTGRKTVSLSCINNQYNENCTFYYKDFLHNKTEKIRLIK